MHWKKAHSSGSNEIYQHWHHDKKLLTLTIHPFSNSARVDCDNERRVFLIRREGLFRNKTVLRNEYGMKVGELGLENGNTYIELNEEKLFYEIGKDDPIRMILFKETKDHPLVSCAWNSEDGCTSVQLEKGHRLISHSGLLMALCWYILQPVTEKTLELVN